MRARHFLTGLAGALCALVLGASPLVAQTGDAPDPAAEFDAVWALFDRHYALFEEKGVDWHAVGEVYRPRIAGAASRADRFALYGEMLGLLNDVHVTVTDEESGRMIRSGGRSLGTGPFDIGEVSLELIARDYAVDGLERRGGNTLRWGWMPGQVGYVHIARFSYPTSVEQAIDAIAQDFAEGGARAVILDVRQNGGGSDAVGRLIASRFAAEGALYMTVETRIPGPSAPGEPRRFTAPEPWHLEPAGPAPFDGPVYVLTNSRSISAAENFVLALRSQPNVTVIGDTTAGVMADTYPVSIEGGWTFDVPINRFHDPDGRSWEGVGLPPHLFVRNDPEEVAAGRDAVLDLALDLAGAPPR